jgi:predicted metal-dependent hydrolase
MNHWRDRTEFRTSVYEWAGRIGVAIRSLYLRPMINKWASCSSAGNLNFNDELLQLEKELGEYVIVHELLHFAIPNHGKLWKSLMRAHLGEFERQEERLKSISSLVPGPMIRSFESQEN